MQLIQSHNLFHRLEHNGETKTAIDTGIQASGPGMTRLKDKLSQNALVISLLQGKEEPEDFQYRKIPLDQVLSFDGTIYLTLNEYFTGNTLQDYLDYQDPISSDEAKLIVSLFKFSRRHSDLLPEQLNPQHILLDGERLLILPAQWSRAISTNENIGSLSKGFEQVNYPDNGMYKSFRLQHFALASSLYRILTGQWPVREENLELKRRFKRKGLITPIEYYLPGLEDWVLQWFDHTLSLRDFAPRGNKTDDDIYEWILNLPSQPPEISTGKHPDSRDTEMAESERLARYFRRMRIERRLQHMKARAPMLTFAGLVAIVLLAVGITVVRNATRDLAVTGLSPDEVVREYYESYNSLDHGFLEEAARGKIGRSRVNRLANLYAVSMVREGTELRSVFVPADEWLNKDPEVREPLGDFMVFGMTDFELLERDEYRDADGETIIEYRVEYIVWDPREDMQGLQGVQNTDELKLREFPRGWQITELRQLSEKSVQP
ncbi:hypothetical protein [Salinispira pacifica]|uniref:Protein kinase domain-containing protein n=1 Tax=Salinispira pacifica TaxID=1307761 RepID=V5WHH1_9SPIO|nr:hypothetical protein [Salinispira pacifica]AHC14994.1 hypothetical protein L21SP2_1609 [Salinispira pacifica]